MCTNHKRREAVPGTKCCAVCIGWRKTRQEKRQAMGLCLVCGNPCEEGYKSCGNCWERGKGLRARNKAAGLCGCGNCISGKGKKCAICLKRANNRVAQFRAAGLCYCGKKPPKEGFTLCQSCLDRRNFKNMHLKSTGRCQCGKPSLYGFKLCPVCRKKATSKAAHRYRTDIAYAISIRLRDCVANALRKRKYRKVGRTEFILGCTFAFARQHIESLFLKGMSWDNVGEWHIDHHIPKDAFDLRGERQQRLCNNWRNLRPLWAADNLSKRNKLPHDYAERLAELELHVPHLNPMDDPCF